MYRLYNSWDESVHCSGSRLTRLFVFVQKYASKRLSKLDVTLFQAIYFPIRNIKN